MKNSPAFIFLLSFVINSSFGQNSYNEGDITLKTQNFFAKKTICFEENNFTPCLAYENLKLYPPVELSP